MESSVGDDNSERKSVKRKLDATLSSSPAVEEDLGAISLQVVGHVTVLNKTVGSSADEDRVAARKAAHSLAELAKHEDYVDILVEEGAVSALVSHLSAPEPSASGATLACEHEVEKESAFALGLLAVKPDHQRLIADAGALPPLVALLKRRIHPPDADGGEREGEGAGEGEDGETAGREVVASSMSVDRSPIGLQGSLGLAHVSAMQRVLNGVIRRAADAITNLAHENGSIKTRVRTEGGIPPLVELLEFADPKVQRAGAGALRTLAFKNEPNKKLIVDCNALPTLIFMLRSADSAIHYEAVGVIGNLVHSSIDIKKQVLQEGALQPVISLLSSPCPESQREAALLLGQFATAEPECKVRIVQRGAVRPLIAMLEAPDSQLREMAAFALGRLAQNSDNQAGIVHDGGLRPLLELLESKNGNLQHNAAFAIYGLADNEDNVSDIVREGGVQRLLEGELIVQASKDCVQKTLKRLEEKMGGKVLKHLLYLLRQADNRVVERRVATALAHLCMEEDQRLIFVRHRALEVLLDMISNPPSPKVQREGALALFTLAKRAAALTPIDAAPPPPTPQVYLGEEFVNSTTLSDVTFLVEGTRFFAHRIALLASSDAFRAMFDGGYREKEVKDIEIPNISRKVFECMMRCIYTGTVEVTADMAQDLLRAADQYLLSGLKRLCEYAIAQGLTVDNLGNIYELAEAYHAQSLRHTCVLFALEHHNVLTDMPGHAALLQRMLPVMKEYIHKVLRPRPPQAPQPQA